MGNGKGMTSGEGGKQDEKERGFVHGGACCCGLRVRVLLASRGPQRINYQTDFARV